MDYKKRKEELVARYNQLNQSSNQNQAEMQRILGQLTLLEELEKGEKVDIKTKK